MKGYTVIELLVALLIFGTVVTGAVGIMVYAVQASREAGARQDIEDNSRAIFGAMIREIRTGYDFAIQGGGRRLVFTGAGTSATAGGGITYELKSNNIERNGLVLNDDDISVNRLDFISNKPGGGDGAVPDTVQPRITVFMELVSAKQPNLSPISLQTTISARSY